MTSGAKVVLVMFGSVLAIAAFVVAAFLLTDGPAVRCVTGELQDNAVRADGSVLPRVETFSTIEEAEGFICRRIPHPRDIDGLTLSEVRVARERNLGDTIEGEGGANVELEYARPDGAIFALAVVFPSVPFTEFSGERIAVQGQEAMLQNPGGIVTVQWNKDGWTFSAGAELEVDFTLEAMLDLLESIR